MWSLALVAAALLAAESDLSTEPADGPGEFLLSLAGTHRFAPGDDAGRAEYDFDDSRWQRVPVPGHRVGWSDLSSAGVGWYRIRFATPAAPESTRLGVNLGVILHGDEVYLNGTLIGATGKISADWVEGPWRERVYSLPRDRLREAGDNVLAVRVLLPEPGGIVAGPLGVVGERPMVNRECGGLWVGAGLGRANVATGRA